MFVTARLDRIQVADILEEIRELEMCGEMILDSEQAHLDLLRSVREQIEKTGCNPEDVPVLIRKDHMNAYASEFAEAIGQVQDRFHWPCNHINWQDATEELESAFESVDFDGVTYLFRP